MDDYAKNIHSVAPIHVWRALSASVDSLFDKYAYDAHPGRCVEGDIHFKKFYRPGRRLFEELAELAYAGLNLTNHNHRWSMSHGYDFWYELAVAVSNAASSYADLERPEPVPEEPIMILADALLDFLPCACRDPGDWVMRISGALVNLHAAFPTDKLGRKIREAEHAAFILADSLKAVTQNISERSREEGKQHMYYERSLVPELYYLLLPGEPLHPLLGLVEQKLEKHGMQMRLDLQFRSDMLHFYLGLTKLIQIRTDKKGFLRTEAAAVYRLHDEVRSSYGPEKADSLRADIDRYLGRVKVNERYLSAEGRCQNWLSFRYGCERTAGTDEPLAIDREVVIGYTNTAEKNRLWEQPIRARALAMAEGLSSMSPELYGRDLHRRPLGDELDLLMWQPPDKLLVTEVKSGGNAHGIYMAPLQLAAYTAAWIRFMRAGSVAGLRALVEQKRALGLIRMDEAEWDSFEKYLAQPRIIPALVVQDPNRDSTCWERLREVAAHVSKQWPKDWGPSPMDSLRVYTVEGPEGDLEDHTDEFLGG